MLTVERAVVAHKVAPLQSAGALRSLWWGALRLPRRGAPSGPGQMTRAVLNAATTQQLFPVKHYVKSIDEW
jgi:hypothetical protein